MDLPSAVVVQQSSGRQSASRGPNNKSNAKIGGYEFLRDLLRPWILDLREPKPTKTTDLS